jgi:hypothetical protein
VLDERARRIAENESRFREINERLEADLRKLPVDDNPVAFVCECGKLACADGVRLTLSEYERVRADPLLFAILPGHEIEDVEDVVAREERFAVVRKHLDAAEVVERADRRTATD